jgi:pheromone a factor receptor
VPYTLTGFWFFLAEVPWQNPYNWNEVHGPKFNTVIRVPSYGRVHIDKWGQVITGFVVFLIFGTGTDAHNTYKKMLLAIGLGKIFPSLYLMRESGGGTPSSFITARSWTASCASKAKSIFSSRSHSISTLDASVSQGSMRNNSVVLETISNPRPASSAASILPREPVSTSTHTSFFKRIFIRSGRGQPILPLFSQHSTSKSFTEESATESASQNFSARAWASEDPGSLQNEPSGVHVIHEIHQDRQERGEPERKSDIWAVSKT